MSKVGIPTSLHISTCILVDKLEKVSLGDLREEVEKIGVDMKHMEELVELLKVDDGTGAFTLQYVVNFETLCYIIYFF